MTVVVFSASLDGAMPPRLMRERRSGRRRPSRAAPLAWFAAVTEPQRQWPDPRLAEPSVNVNCRRNAGPCECGCYAIDSMKSLSFKKWAIIKRFPLALASVSLSTLRMRGFFSSSRLLSDSSRLWSYGDWSRIACSLDLHNLSKLNQLCSPMHQAPGMQRKLDSPIEPHPLATARHDSIRTAAKFQGA